MKSTCEGESAEVSDQELARSIVAGYHNSHKFTREAVLRAASENVTVEHIRQASAKNAQMAYGGRSSKPYLSRKKGR